MPDQDVFAGFDDVVDHFTAVCLGILADRSPGVRVAPIQSRLSSSCESRSLQQPGPSGKIKYRTGRGGFLL